MPPSKLNIDSPLPWRIRAIDLAERFGVAAIALLMALFLALTRPETFPTSGNLANIARQTPYIAVLALGEFFTILTAGIDLSISSVMALSMVTLALAVHAGVPVIICVFTPLLIGCLFGLLNGIGLTRLRLPHAFIMTLGTQYIARGLTNLISGGVPISGLPPSIRWLGASDIELSKNLAIPWAFIAVLLLYSLVGVFLHRTVTGRRIYAVGGNPKAARYAGIDVDRILVIVYTLSGTLAGLAGLILAGRTGSGYPNAGLGDELYAIAAVIIGGTSFFGGRGNLLGVFAGVIIIGLLRNGLNLFNVSVFWQQVLIGVIVITVVYGDVLRQQIAQRFQRGQ